MEAHRLLAAAPYEPDAVKMLGRVFDDAWATIASTIKPDAVTNARIRLAHVVLAHYALHKTSDRLKAAAIAAFQKQEATPRGTTR